MSLKKTVETLAAMTAKINRLSDEALAMVTAVEEYLTEIGAGSQASWEHPTEKYVLRWGKHAGRFRVLVCSLGPQPEPVKAWGDCSRYLRLKMFVGVPALLVAIRQEIQTLYEVAHGEVQQTMKALERIMAPVED